MLPESLNASQLSKLQLLANLHLHLHLLSQLQQKLSLLLLRLLLTSTQQCQVLLKSQQEQMSKLLLARSLPRLLLQLLLMKQLPVLQCHTHSCCRRWLP